MFNLALADDYPRQLHEQRMREAEMQRLVDLAAGPRRPFRSILAGMLVGLANRIEGSPRGSLVLSPRQ